MRRWSRQLFIAASLLLALPGVASATSPGDPTMTSNNYSAVETEVGGNGCNNSPLNACGSSSNYSVNPTVDDGGSSLGESTVGNSASAHYQTNAGFNTTGAPGLTMLVNTSSASLGVLNSGAVTFASATFDVTDYTSYGFVVQVVGSTLTNGSNTIPGLTTDTASSAGTPQFGFDLVRNTSAANGSNPFYVPDGVTYPSVSQFSFGVAGDGSTGTYGTSRPYTISDKYRFNSGDTIASSPQTSGDTRFTMTFMANIAPTTAAGAYTSNLALVATGTY